MQQLSDWRTDTNVKLMFFQFISVHNKFGIWRHQRNDRNRRDGMNGSFLHFPRLHQYNSNLEYSVFLSKSDEYFLLHPKSYYYYNTLQTWSNVWMIRSFNSSFHSSPFCSCFENYLKYLFTKSNLRLIFISYALILA